MASGLATRLSLFNTRISRFEKAKCQTSLSSPLMTQEIHKRRYLLKNTAIEIFLTTGRTYLLAFDNRQKRNETYEKARALVTHALHVLFGPSHMLCCSCCHWNWLIGLIMSQKSVATFSRGQLLRNGAEERSPTLIILCTSTRLLGVRSMV